jgi:hypothetical protein
LLFSVGLLAAFSFAQQRDGIYRAPGAPAATWSINDHRTLMWNGLPYLPVGLRIDGTPEAIAEAFAKGVTDVIVELPASGVGWKEAFAELEAKGMRYLIALTSLAPTAYGMAVSPQAYRIEGIERPQPIMVRVPGASSALVALVLKRDGELQDLKRVPIIDGQLSYDANPKIELEHVVLIYPQMQSMAQPDYWDGLDGHRDRLLAALKHSPPGPGLRGIVNPLGNLINLASHNTRFVPTSTYFRYELAEYLESRYRNLRTVERVWAMRASDTESFEDLARLVPLWSGNRGVGQLWDPATEKLYAVDMKRSLIWQDIEAVLTRAAARRFSRLVAGIRGMADVPVVQEWAGWASPYEGQEPPVDGIGITSEGSSLSQIIEQGSRAASSIMRWRSRGWLVATDLDLTKAGDVVWHVPAVLDDCASLGARGWFFKTQHENVIQMLVQENAARSRHTWYAQTSPQPLFFPENALNPAVPRRLPGDGWWLPSPAAGNRVDLGNSFNAYRYGQGPDAFFVLWTTGQPVRTRLRMLDPKVVQVRNIDGTDPAAKVVRGGLEVTITQSPMIITGTEELPIPEIALQETVAGFEKMAAAAAGARIETSQEVYSFRQHHGAFEKNPGGSFPMLRQMYHRMVFRLGTFYWLELEYAKDTTFSESVSMPGASNVGALVLATQLAARPEGYYANFTIPVRTQEEQEVWLAARIPADKRKDVKIIIGSQILRLDEAPISMYGPGFAWYRAGVTRLSGNNEQVRLVVDSPEGADMAFDVLLLHPGRFTPDGVRVPELRSLPQPMKKPDGSDLDRMPPPRN